ncbi:MAG: hypothetical protein HGA71_11060 [Azonexaceae bacterium]|nr:hypothetical protein [Azonexaceae bacterium]
MPAPEHYTPNQVPLKTRILRTLGSLGLIAYGVLGVVIDDIVIPGKRSSLHLHGLPAWLMALAMVCAAITLISLVVDHYDRKNNEPSYRRLETRASKLGWILAGLATGSQIAGIHYPQPSKITTLSAILGLFVMGAVAAIGFVKTQSAPSQPPQEATSPAPSILSVILGWVFIFAGGIVLLLALPGIPAFKITHFIAAAAAICIIAVGLVIRRPAEAAPASTTSFQHWKAVRVSTLLIVGLGVIWYAKSRQWSEWLDQDEQERQTAPAWAYHFEDFTAGISRAHLQKHLGQEGFHMRCYGNLKVEERLEPDDREVCWTIANNTDGIPSRMITFWFGDDGLRQIRMDFGKSEWPAVQKWFEGQGSFLFGNFGREQGGQLIVGRRGKTGLILTAAPGPLNSVMVLWQSREILQQRSCAKADSSIGENWGALCQNWPAWQPPAGFTQRHQPAQS